MRGAHVKARTSRLKTEVGDSGRDPAGSQDETMRVMVRAKLSDQLQMESRLWSCDFVEDSQIGGSLSNMCMVGCQGVQISTRDETSRSWALEPGSRV